MSDQNVLKAIKELIAKFDKLEKKVEEMDAVSKTRVELSFNELSEKLDILANLNSSSVSAVVESTTRKINKPTFFKKIFNEQRDEYLNTLYTQEEIDAVAQLPEVLAKRKDTEKNNKIATLIYNKHIKENNPSGRWALFESIYEQNI